MERSPEPQEEQPGGYGTLKLKALELIRWQCDLDGFTVLGPKLLQGFQNVHAFFDFSKDWFCYPVTRFWCADEKLGTIWTQCSICHGQCARTCVLRIKSSFSDPFSTSILQNFSSAQGVPLSLAPSAGHIKEQEEHSGLTMVVGKRPQGTGSAKPCFRDFSLVFNFTVFCSYLYYFSFVLHLNLFSFIFKIKLWDRI